MMRKLLFVLLLCAAPCYAFVTLTVGDRIHSNMHGGQDGTVVEVGTEIERGYVKIHWDYMARGEVSDWVHITPFEVLEQRDRPIYVNPDQLP
jgi:hypothetical protein